MRPVSFSMAPVGCVSRVLQGPSLQLREMNLRVPSALQDTTLHKRVPRLVCGVTCTATTAGPVHLLVLPASHTAKESPNRRRSALVLPPHNVNAKSISTTTHGDFARNAPRGLDAMERRARFPMLMMVIGEMPRTV